MTQSTGVRRKFSALEITIDLTGNVGCMLMLPVVKNGCNVKAIQRPTEESICSSSATEHTLVKQQTDGTSAVFHAFQLVGQNTQKGRVHILGLLDVQIGDRHQEERQLHRCKEN